ncbi:hypothetical protein MRX96_017954 [Rhipicephalus microplus]
MHQMEVTMQDGGKNVEERADATGVCKRDFYKFGEHVRMEEDQRIEFKAHKDIFHRRAVGGLQGPVLSPDHLKNYLCLLEHWERFHRGDLDDLIAGMLIPGEVISVQRVQLSDPEVLRTTMQRLAYPNELCDLETILNCYSSVISSEAVNQKNAALKTC